MENIYVTLGEMISKVDKHKINAYSDEIKTEWITKVEGRVQIEIMEKGIDDVIVYDWEKDKGKNLLVPHPYTDIYRYYLYAMIDFENKEIAAYNNDITMFNAEFESYQAWYRKAHGDSMQIRNIW